MATFDASIKRALACQEDLKGRREHCSVDPEALAMIGCALGQQVRIKRDSGEFGLYTGWKQGGGARERWHITSVDLSPASFPLLNTVISRGFTHAVAFHGFDRPDRPGILIGGAAPATVKADIRAAIAGAVGSGIEVGIAELGDILGGDRPGNIVNRLTGGANGIQIEQSPQARSGHWRAIADAVADVYDRQFEEV